jgi:hypothetical protein
MLADVAVLVTQIVLISFIILGTIGNVLNLAIFTRPTLLRSSCTLYLIATSIDNIVVIYTSLLTRLLADGFSYDITLISNFMCKLRYYGGYIFLAASPYFCILACFDRYCASSTSATRRSWCNKKLSIRLIIGAIILACTLYLHMAFLFELKIVAGNVVCYSRAGVYTQFYKLFYLVIYCLLPSVCMAVLCILTIINVRQQARRITPALATGNDTLHRIDRQMIRMLFLQVLTQLLCVLPFAMLSLMSLFVDRSTNIFNFFEAIFILPLFVSYTTSFYVFTLSSRIYREELMKIIWFWKRRQDANELTVGTHTISATTRQHGKIKANLEE